METVSKYFFHTQNLTKIKSRFEILFEIIAVCYFHARRGRRRQFIWFVFSSLVKDFFPKPDILLQIFSNKKEKNR